MNLEPGQWGSVCSTTLLSVFKVISPVAEGTVSAWMLPSVFLLSRPDRFVPMSCSASSSKPTHMMGNFPVLTISYCADIHGKQEFSYTLMAFFALEDTDSGDFFI